MPDYLEKSLEVSKESTCFRTKIGCVLVKDDEIIATGYNGAPDNVSSCIELDKCTKEESGKELEAGNAYCRGVHAEVRCLLQASPKKAKGATLYTSKQPCSECTKILIQAGVDKVIWAYDWGAGGFSEHMRNESNVDFHKEEIEEKKMIAIIPCKANSERLPGKNVKLLAGKPMVNYTIEAALKSGSFSEVWVTSESQEILDALPDGVEKHLRPEELSAPTAPVYEVCHNLLTEIYGSRRPLLPQDSFAVLLATSPLRTSADIKIAAEKFTEAQPQCLMSVEKVSHLPEHMLTIKSGRLCYGSDIDKKRQELEPRFVHDGNMLICNTQEFLNVKDFYDLDLMPLELEKRPDVNTQADWDFVEWKIAGQTKPYDADYI